jgi:hypothetical protein
MKSKKTKKMLEQEGMSLLMEAFRLVDGRPGHLNPEYKDGEMEAYDYAIPKGMHMPFSMALDIANRGKEPISVESMVNHQLKVIDLAWPESAGEYPKKVVDDIRSLAYALLRYWLLLAEKGKVALEKEPNIPGARSYLAHQQAIWDKYEPKKKPTEDQLISAAFQAWEEDPEVVDGFAGKFSNPKWGDKDDVDYAIRHNDHQTKWGWLSLSWERDIVYHLVGDGENYNTVDELLKPIFDFHFDLKAKEKAHVRKLAGKTLKIWLASDFGKRVRKSNEKHRKELATTKR